MSPPRVVGSWDFSEYPFDYRTLRIAAGIKDGHHQVSNTKFTFTAWSPSFMKIQYNRQWQQFVKGMTLQKQIGKAWLVTEETPDEFFSPKVTDASVDEDILANPAKFYGPGAVENSWPMPSGYPPLKYWRNVSLPMPSMGGGHVILVHVKRNPVQWIANNLLPMIFCVMVTYSSSFIPQKLTMPRIATTALSLIAAINLLRGIQAALPANDALTAAELVYFGLLTNVVLMTVGHATLFWVDGLDTKTVSPEALLHSHYTPTTHPLHNC
jgi:hypothetical protein